MIFQIGVSILVAFFTGIVSTVLFLDNNYGRTGMQSDSFFYEDQLSAELPPHERMWTQNSDLAFPEEPMRTVPSPELPTGAVFLLGITLANPVDSRQRVVMRRAWTNVWRNPSLITGTPRRLLGSSGWLNNDMDCQEYFRHYFVVSQFALIRSHVRQEAEVEEDLLFTELNMFASSSLKLLWALKWAMQHTKFHYMVQTTPMTFLYVPSTIWWLRESRYVTRSNYYAGRVVQKAGVIRDGRSPWVVSKLLYSGTVYPDYVAQECLVMSRDIVRALTEEWLDMTSSTGQKRVQQFLHIPDIDIAFGLRRHHEALEPRSIVHVYSSFAKTPSLCRDLDLMAIGHVPEEVLLRSNASNGYHICEGRS